MRFMPTPTGTRIELDGDYRLPLGPIGRAVDRLLRRAGTRGAARELRRLAQLISTVT